MKKQSLLLLLFIILSINCYSQINFEKGYYINNSNQKIDCLIKNIDWKNNPTQFTYKLLEQAEQKTISIKLVKEFGIYNTSKYIRHTVNIDRSSNYVNELSHDKNPIFKKEELFLKVLVEGKANLYVFEDGNLQRYFFNTDSVAIEQLIYKKYKTADNKIGFNNGFKQQLWTNLKCDDITLKSIKNVDYNRKELFNFFMKYNECHTSEIITFEQNKSQYLFNLSLRPGIRSTSLSIDNRALNPLSVNFDNELGFTLGIEIELILPFNNNKWAFIIEPTYQTYKSEKTKTDNPFDLAVPPTVTYSVDYESIELPIGIRHYFFLNNNSKIFVNGSFIIDIPSEKSNINKNLKIKTGNNLAFGLGYKYNDTYSLELRYATRRDLFRNYLYWESNHSSLSMIFGYTLF